MNQQKSLKTEAGIFVVQYGGTRKKNKKKQQQQITKVKDFGPLKYYELTEINLSRKYQKN